MSDELSQELIDELVRDEQRLDAKKSKIRARIEEIVDYWCNTFDIKFYSFTFDNEIGDYDPYAVDDYIWGIVVESSHDPFDTSIIDKNGREFIWDGNIPTRWLWEDYKVEITKGKKLRAFK